MLNEKQLVKLCVKKDRRARRQLFDRYSGLLLGICRRYVAETSEAEDILQEGFLKVYLKIREFKGTGPLIAWMTRIIINTAIIHYHKNRKHHFHSDIGEVNETDIEGFIINDVDFTRDELLKVVDSLPHGYRIIFNLYAVEGFKHKEIVELLKIDINTSKSQYSRARKLIRKKLENLSKDNNIKPEQSLYDNTSKVPIKISVFGGVQVIRKGRLTRPIDESLSIAFLFKKQADFSQMDLGLYWYKNPLIIGVWYRGIPILKDQIGDAIILLAGYKTKYLHIGYSYDFTVSNLITSTGGAHEISFVYNFKLTRKHKKKIHAIPCPEF